MLSTSNAPKKLFLLDAMALIYRAHFAFSRAPRMTSTGIDTGAILGFANTVWDILQREQPTHIGIAFDTAAPTFRHQEFEAYKAHREKQPEAISEAQPYIKRLIKGMRIPILELDGYEADDIVGTLAKKASQMGFEVYMVTIDKDYAQLVEEHIFLYKVAYAGRNPAEVWGIKEVCARWQIQNPMQLTDILGLQGDASDNIPGIPGIGEKTAIKLIQQFGSVENLVANADKLKGKQKENVINFGKQGILSKRLATINIDVPIKFEPERLILEELDKQALSSLFDELEFRTLKRRMLGEELQQSVGAPAKANNTGTKKSDETQMNLFGMPTQAATGKSTSTLTAVQTEKAVDELPFDFGTEPREVPTAELPTNVFDTIKTTKHDYHLLTTAEERMHLIEFLKIQDEICLDTETSSLEVMEAKLVGMSIAYRPFEAFYIPFPKDEDETKAILKEFEPVFTDEKIMKIGQNIKYDFQILYRHGIELKGQFFDTMLAHYVLEPELRHGMDYLAQTLLNYQPITYEEIVGKGKNQRSMAELSAEQIKDYAAEDADITLRLKSILHQKLEQDADSKRIFYDIEMPLVAVLAKMELNGVKIDEQNLQEYSQQLGNELAQLEKKIYQLAGEEFNIASPKQLGEILFDKLNLTPKPKRTAKSKQYKTDERILVKLADSYPIAALILEYRQLQKLKSTYVDALPLLISKKDHKIHTSFNQAVTVTGRLSSTNPNLQNIPIRTTKGREVRKAFVPSGDTHVLLAVDYSQIELRLMAAFSQDQTMIEAFREGKDIHAATAAKIYKVPLSEVTPDMRRAAKIANFGIIYGVSAMGLGQRLNIKASEAKKLIDSYFAEFPAVKAYMDRAINTARNTEQAQTLLGRKRPLRDINSRNATQRGFAERNAINMPIQGTAADIIKLAMVKVQQYLEENNLQTKMILQVHDELVFDVPKTELETVKPTIMKLMTQAYPIDVPLEVEAGVGSNWLEAH